MGGFCTRFFLCFSFSGVSIFQFLCVVFTDGFCSESIFDPIAIYFFVAVYFVVGMIGLRQVHSTIFWCLRRKLEFAEHLRFTHTHTTRRERQNLPHFQKAIFCKQKTRDPHIHLLTNFAITLPLPCFILTHTY
jgi:hypothetical protein